MKFFAPLFFFRPKIFFFSIFFFFAMTEIATFCIISKRHLPVDTTCCVCLDDISDTNPTAEKLCVCTASTCISCSEITTKTSSGQACSVWKVACFVCNHKVKVYPVVGKLSDHQVLTSPSIKPGTEVSAGKITEIELGHLLTNAKLFNSRITMFCTICSSNRTPPMFSAPNAFVRHLQENHEINMFQM